MSVYTSDLDENNFRHANARERPKFLSSRKIILIKSIAIINCLEMCKNFFRKHCWNNLQLKNIFLKKSYDICNQIRSAGVHFHALMLIMPDFSLTLT